VLAASAVTLRLCVNQGWVGKRDPAAQALPLIAQTCAAMAVAVAAQGPFGDTERAAGIRLPWLRLAGTGLLTAIAGALLALAVVASTLPGGDAELLRDLAGMTGVALLSAQLLSGALSWIGPLAYLVLAEYALDARWQTPWIWSDRPSHDIGAALCAYGAFAVGMILTTTRGARDTKRD
jgi:hypothetical protein